MFDMPLREISAHGMIDKIISLGSDLTICELGVCRGHNLRYLLDRAPNISKVYAIDPWLPYDDWCGHMSSQVVESWMHEALRLLEQYDDRITLLKAKSIDSSVYIQDDELDYIFIDGDHSYDATIQDMVTYYSKVKSNGIFSGHDYQLDSVRRAVTEFRENNHISSPLLFADNNVWYWHKD